MTVVRDAVTVLGIPGHGTYCICMSNCIWVGACEGMEMAFFVLHKRSADAYNGAVTRRG